MTHPDLTDADLDRLRRKLMRERDAIIGAKEGRHDVLRGVPDGEIEPADVAERAIEQEGALRLGVIDDALLADLDRALAKLEAGTYGVSEETGAPIPIARLDAIPWARRTAEEEVRATGHPGR